MSFSTKTFAVGSLLFGAAASGAGAQTLNPMDLYLSVVEKEALLPEKQQRRISVTIGNGTTSYPTDRAATLTVTMDEALANSIVAENLGNSWGTSSYAGVSCDPITKPFTVVNGRVDATCTIPILPTGAKFDLGIELIGQEAWTSHYLGAKITPLAGERFTNNQSESLVITSVEVADLSIQTVVKQAGNPDQTITPTSGATIAALGGESFSFEAMVTNNGSSSADSFVVTVPRLQGFTDYTMPAGCADAVLDGTPVYSCEIKQRLDKGQSYVMDYFATVMTPQAGGSSSSVPMNNIVSLTDGSRKPRDINGENNSLQMIFEVAPGGDVSVAKRLTTPAAVVRGDTIGYSITPNYLGLSPQRVKVVDIIPEGFEVVDFTPAASCDYLSATRELVCEIDASAVGTASARTDLPSIGLQLKALDDAPAALVNSATVSLPSNAASLDTNQSNNTASAPMVAIAIPEFKLGVEKSRINSDNPGFAVIGQDVSYELQATNTGNMSLTDKVVITDNLPLGLAYSGFSGAGWTCLPAVPNGGVINGPAQISCTYPLSAGKLDPAKSLGTPVVLNTKVVGFSDPDDGSGATRFLVNGADALWTGPDGTPFTFAALPHSMIIDKVDRVADLEVTKSRDLATVNIGDYQTYSFSMKNHGYLDPDTGVNSRFAAKDVTVTDILTNLFAPYNAADAMPSVVIDQLPAGMACAITPVGTTSAELVCTTPSFAYCDPNGGPACPDMVVRVRQGGIDQLRKANPQDTGLTQINSVSILSAVTPDPDYKNNDSRVSHQVVQKFALKLDKVSNQDDNGPGFAVGQGFDYTITVSNLAALDGTKAFTFAPGFKVEDTLPAGIRVLSITPTGSGLECDKADSLPKTTIAGSKFSCIFNEGLAVGDVRTITIKAEGTMELIKSMTGDPRSVEIDNTAAIVFNTPADAALEVSTTAAPAAADNSDNAKVRMIEGVYDLAITKTVQNAYLNSGDMAYFTLRVTNVGLSRAEEVKVIDGLPPADLFQFKRAYVVGSTNANACSTSVSAGHALEYTTKANKLTNNLGAGTAISCELGDILPEQVIEIKVEGRMLTAGSDKNYASVSAKVDPLNGVQDDINYLNNFSDTSVTAQELVDLKLQKSVLPPAKAGSDRFDYDENITFLITMQNIARTTLAPGTEPAADDYRPFYTDASDVVIADTLPTGLAYTGGITLRLDGVAAAGLCAAPVAGSTAFRCEVPSVANGSIIEVELPTMATASCATLGAGACKTDPVTKEQYFELVNKAKVTASSAQPVPDVEPDDASVPVQILLSSISGHYWWDLKDNLLSGSADNWAYDADADRLIKGMTLTLQTKDAGGNWVDRATTTTDDKGFYHFDYLPPDTYRIIDKTSFTNGVTSVGGKQGVIGAVTAGQVPLQGAPSYGTASNINNNGPSRSISEIVLEADRHGVNYDLRIVPVPEIKVVKDVAMTQLANAVLELTYTIKVENTSMEPLQNVQLTDPLDYQTDTNGVRKPLFYAYNAALKDLPEGDASARNLGAGVNYALRSIAIATSKGSVITAQPSYTGAETTADVIFSGAELAVAEVATVTMKVVVNLGQPMGALPASFVNAATGKGVGKWTGFTSDGAGTTPVQDDSTRTTPTVKKTDDASVAPSLTSAVDLQKDLVDRAQLNTSYDGKLVYQFTITNTGAVPLSDIVLSDAKLGVTTTAQMQLLFTDLADPAGSSITGPLRPAKLDLLLAGESVTLYGAYTLGVDDAQTLAAGALQIDNTARVDAVGHEPVTDTATQTTTTNLALVKTAVLPHAGMLKAGDVIHYTLRATNTGNLPLRAATITDADLIASGGTVTGSTETTIGPFDLDAGASREFPNAFAYVLTQSDIDAVAPTSNLLLQPVATGDNLLRNVARISGSFVPGTPTLREDDAEVTLTRTPLMNVSKLAQRSFTSTEAADTSDTITYAVLVENTGNTRLDNLRITDAQVGLTGYAPLAPFDSLEAGESVLFYGTGYDLSSLATAPTRQSEIAVLRQPVTWAQIEAKTLENVASVTATPPGKPDLTREGKITTTFLANPRIALEKTVSATTAFGFDEAGLANQPVTYSFLVTNTGNVPLSDVEITDPLLRRTLDVSAQIGGDGRLLPGQSQTITLPNYSLIIDPTGTGLGTDGQPTADYALLLAGLNAGNIVNSAEVTSTYETQTPRADDTATIPMDAKPKFAVEKTVAKVATDGRSVDWTITVTNTGNVNLTNLLVTDARLKGRTAAGFDADGHYIIASLDPQKDYVITVTGDPTSLAERDAGKAVNKVIVSYPSVNPQVTVEDTEEAKLPAEASVVITKDDDPTFSVDNGRPQAGAVTVTYDFWIKNTGSVSLSDLRFEDGPLGVVIEAGKTAVIDQSKIPAGSAALVKVQINEALLRYLPPASDYAAFVKAQTDPAAWPAMEADGSIRLGSITWPLRQEWLDDPSGSHTNIAAIFGKPPVGPTDKDNKPLLPVINDDDTVTTHFDPYPEVSGVKTGVLVDQANQPLAADVPTQVGDWILWDFTVTNTGNVTLGYDRNGTQDPFTLSEPAGLDGFEWVTADGNLGRGAGLVWTFAPLAPGQSVTVQGRSKVTLADLRAGSLANTARVAAKHPAKPEVSTDPQTKVHLTLAPKLEIVKELCTTCTAPTNHMRFKITVTNSGNVDLDQLVVTEQAKRISFVADPSFTAQESLDPTGQIFTRNATFAMGDVKVLYADYLVPDPAVFTDGIYDADDLAYYNAGKVTNVATASGKATHPDPAPGDDPDLTPAPVSDDAIGSLSQLPSVMIKKTVVDPAPQAGVSVVNPADLNSTITYGLVVTNTGNVTLTNLVVSDPRLLLEVTLPSLDPGKSVDIKDLVAPEALMTTPTQAELDASRLLNTASVSTTHNGTPIADDDSTQTTLLAEPAISLVKTATREDPAKPAVVGEVVSYDFTITNVGDITLSAVTLADDLFGTGWTHVFDGDLAPQQSVVHRVDYALTLADVDRGWLYNTAKVGGGYTDENGLPQLVEAEDEVIVTYTAAPQMTLVKTADATALTTPPDVGQKITYRFTLTNISEVTAKEITLTDLLDGVQFDGATTLAALAPQAVHVFTATYALRQEDLDRGQVENTATASSSFVPDPNLPPGFVPPAGFTPPQPSQMADVQSSPAPEVDPAPTLTPLVMKGIFTARKSANMETVFLGDSVTYTLSFESQSSGVVKGMHFVDRLPTGLIYTPDSAKVAVAGEGQTAAAVAMEPVVAGRRLDWGAIEVPRKGNVTITFQARVSQIAPFGKLTNETWSEDRDGEKNSNTAIATVLRQPEHVFACSDVTGKVFEDFNHNGRQDPLDRSALTNDDVYDGKWGKYETLPKDPRGERGLAHVRLVTPTGTVITTDAHGRYSVPCAELPRDLGSNFTLKLDTRSLPSGYRVTTENPRTLRLTAGKAAEMNFGVAMSKLVRLDLSAAAFDGTTAAPSAALAQALADYARAAGDDPVVIHLGYRLAAGEDQAVAKRRLKAVEALLIEKWQGRRANLLIERSIEKSAR